MKRLLKVSLMLIAVVCFFASCSSDDDDDYDSLVEYATLPTKAKSLIETHFSDAAVTQVKKKYVADDDGSLYDVYLSTGFELDFDTYGSWTSIESKNKTAIPNSLFGTEIPMMLKTHANTEYPNVAIVDVEKESYGFKIELATGIDLKYKENGDFIGLDK